MQKERWQKIEEIFFAAAEFHGPARENFLRDNCLGDEAMLSEIRALLAEHESPSTSLDTPVFDIGVQMLDGNDVDKRTGETIGHFKLGRLIGRGGMGEVYAAEDQKLGRKVAVKLLNKLFALDPERIRRFRKEAKAVSRVVHPNVAKLYEVCEIDGENLIVMEFVEGINLRKHLAVSIPLGEAIDIVIQIASALGAAHTAGVVHRDIKPENIVITPNGAIKVLDFGLAKLVSPIGDGTIHIQGGENVKLTVDMSTELGALVGTPAYMSPEQIRGSEVGTQTDIWSLGVLLYEMVSGELPFRGLTKIDQIAAVLMSSPEPIRNLRLPFQAELDTIIAFALSKEKSGRYGNIDDMLNDLTKIREMSDARRQSASELRSGSLLSGFGRYLQANLIKAILILGIAVLSMLVFLQLTKSNPAKPPIGFTENAVIDFSITSNPSGNWSYGYTPSDDISLFSLFTSSDHDRYFKITGMPIDKWQNQDSPHPLITHNSSDTAITAGGVFLPPDLLDLHPGKEGQRSVLRWTAPAKGVYRFDGHFQGIDLSGTTTDAVIVLNSKLVLFNENINGFGIPKAFVLSRELAAGDTVDFSVGYGGNGFNSDSTGAYVAVTKIPLSDSLQSGPVSYWPADGNAYDLLGGNDGELLNGATYKPGVSGQAFSFDGVDGRVSVPNSSNLNVGTGDFTITFFAMFDNLENNTNGMVHKDNYGDQGSYNGWLFNICDFCDEIGGIGVETRNIVQTSDNDARYPKSNFQVGIWYHIAAVRQSNVLYLYIDGVLRSTTPERVPTDLSNSSNLEFGALSSGSRQFFSGALDEIYFFNRALSADEIQSLFSAYTPPNN